MLRELWIELSILFLRFDRLWIWRNKKHKRCFQFSFWDSRDNEEITYYIFTYDFQFSFWDSSFQLVFRMLVGFGIFQFSFWDSTWFSKALVWDIYELSILFLRFRRCQQTHEHKATEYTFNSLFEIPRSSPTQLYSSLQPTFNSLFEIQYN